MRSWCDLKKVRLNRDWGWSAYRLGLFSLTPEMVEHVYPNDVQPDLVLKGRSTLVPWDIDRKANTVRLRTPKSQVHPLEFPAQPMLGCIGVAPGGRLRADLGAVGLLRRQPRLQQDRRGGDGLPAGLSPGRPAVRRRRPRPPGRRRADRHRDRDVDGRGVRRRAEEGREADRPAGRDGRRDHQHRLAARVRQRPRQRPQDGHQRHGRVARQGLRHGALGRPPADRLPGALRRGHRRRLDGPLRCRRTGCRRRSTRRSHQARGDRRSRPTPRSDRREDARAPQDRRLHPALLGRAARASSGWRSRGSTTNSSIRSRWRPGSARTRSGSTAGSSASRGWWRSGGSGRRSCWSSRTTSTGR